MIYRLSAVVFSLLLLAGAGYAADDWADVWRGFMIHKSGLPVFRTDIKYILQPDGQWSIQEADQPPVPQGWYKVDAETLFLQPRQAAQQNLQAAITARIAGNAFEIDNPVDETFKMRFLRSSALPRLTAQNLRGKWKIAQRNLFTDEIKTAPYILIIEANGTYRVEQPGQTLPAEWAVGTYDIADDILTLQNHYSGDGLWNRPSFFQSDDCLRYNDRHYALWCERLDAESANRIGGNQP